MDFYFQKCFLITCVIFLGFLISSTSTAGGRGGSRGVGGATGVRYRHKEGDETGTVNVILVVLLPVAQMLLVLIVIVLVRVAYVKYFKKSSNNPKLLQVVTSAQLHRNRLLLSEYELQQQLDTLNIPPPSIRQVLMAPNFHDSKKLTKSQLKQQEKLLTFELLKQPSLDSNKY